jgi:hypothetical protein
VEMTEFGLTGRGLGDGNLIDSQVLTIFVIFYCPAARENTAKYRKEGSNLSIFHRVSF